MSWWDVLKIGFPAVLTFFAGRASTRLDRRHEQRDAEAAKAPEFTVWPDGGSLRLQNTGDGPATGIMLDFGEYPRERVQRLPDGPFDLAEGASIIFYMSSGLNLQKPPDVVVRCAELASPRHVAIPR
ncbi:hypothetical protein [Amycolatopsis sp. NPDC004169]|uniref:hypothetical protein n=1 Tax=Amycolatopsis sp. NPDC004169 TaxID=3154453 RepID=UPI0033B7B3C4